MKKTKRALAPAMAFIVLMGLISLFSDMTHEGAASILGAYLSLAGASAAAIGFISGFGELIGYGLRLLTGWLADKTKKYWLLTLLGYALDCAAVPALALVPRGGWQLACLLIILRRTGKAIKKPAKNTLVSFAAMKVGVGRGFALLEMLDQIGAVLGPVLLFAVLAVQKNADTYTAYRVCFAILGIPALVCLALLALARFRFPAPEQFEPETGGPAPKFRLEKKFLFYIAGISLFAFGFADFSLVEMHVVKKSLMSADTLPLLYAGAMLVDAGAAFLFGRLYDRHGIRVLMPATALSSAFAIFVFLGGSLWLVWIGVLLWGVGMGAQESILKAAVTSIVPKSCRSTGFGIFETSFGVCWFLGSWLIGILYDCSPALTAAVSAAAQLAAIPLFGLTARQHSVG